MQQFSMEQRTRKHVKEYGFLSLARKNKKKTIIGCRTRCCKKCFLKSSP